MDKTILARKHALFSGAIVVLALTLAALLVALVAARPSEAAESITIDPSNIGFGAVTLSADAQTRTVTITNNGLAAITIGSIDYSGLPGTEIGTFETLIGPGGLLVGAGQTATLDVDFDPATTGFKQATGTIKDLLGVEIVGAPTLVVSGTGVTTQPAGAPSDCTIVGTNSGERLTGTSGKDVICALGGADRVFGRGSGDIERGGSGNDLISDKMGRDKLLGQGGKDRLNARDGGRDLLKGGGRNDRCAKDKRDRTRSC